MKSFYEFYRRLQANKLFEQAPATPTAPPMGGASNQLPPLGPPPAMPGNMPMSAPDMGMEMPSEDMASPTGEENVDSVEGIDTTTPEGMILQNIVDLETAIEMAKEGGTNISKDNMNVLKDIADMIKKNIEKSQEKSAPMGDMGGMAAPEGPPMGDQAVMAGMSPDMGAAAPAALPPLSSESTIYTEETDNSFNYDNIRLAWGQIRVDAGKQKGYLACTKQQPYDPENFWKVFSHPDDDVRVIGTLYPQTDDGTMTGKPVLDEKGKPIYKERRRMIRKPASPMLAGKSTRVEDHFADGKQWIKHLVIAPMKGIRGVRTDPATHANLYQDPQTKQWFRGTSKDALRVKMYKPGAPRPSDLLSRNLLKKIELWKPVVSSDGSISLDQSSGVKEACFNMKMIERMIFCGWIPENYVETRFAKIEEDNEHFSGISCYIDKSSLNRYTYGKQKKQQIFEDKKEEFIKQSQDLIATIVDNEKSFNEVIMNVAKSIKNDFENDNENIDVLFTKLRKLLAVLPTNRMTVDTSVQQEVDRLQRSLPASFTNLKTEQNEIESFKIIGAIYLLDSSTCEEIGFSDPQLVPGSATEDELPTFKSGEDITYSSEEGEDEDHSESDLIMIRNTIIEKVYPKTTIEPSYKELNPLTKKMKQLPKGQYAVVVKRITGKDGTQKKVYLVINQKTGMPVMPRLSYVPLTGDPVKDAAIKNLNNEYRNATYAAFDDLVRKLKFAEKVKLDDNPERTPEENANYSVTTQLFDVDSDTGDLAFNPKVGEEKDRLLASQEAGSVKVGQRQKQSEDIIAAVNLFIRDLTPSQKEQFLKLWMEAGRPDIRRGISAITSFMEKAKEYVQGLRKTKPKLVRKKSKNSASTPEVAPSTAPSTAPKSIPSTASMTSNVSYPDFSDFTAEDKKTLERLEKYAASLGSSVQELLGPSTRKMTEEEKQNFKEKKDKLWKLHLGDPETRPGEGFDSYQKVALAFSKGINSSLWIKIQRLTEKLKQEGKDPTIDKRFYALYNKLEELPTKQADPIAIEFYKSIGGE